MFYISINGKVLPTPYQTFPEAMEECIRVQKTMVAVVVKIVSEADLLNN
jgi:hypothetical protein